MSFYTTAFKDICADPLGEGMDVRAYIRRTDGENRLPRSGLWRPDVDGSFVTEAVPGTWADATTQTYFFYGYVSAATLAAAPGPHPKMGSFYIGNTAAWAALRHDKLGLYDSNRDEAEVLAGTITLSALVRPAASIAYPFGLGIFNRTTTSTRKFRFNSNTSQQYTSADVVDTDGKAGIIALADYPNWYHVWCALDLADLGWNADDLEVLVFPNADNTDIFHAGPDLAGVQVAYNYDYDNSPEPKGIYPVHNLTPLVGQPGTAVDLNSIETVVSMNPIRVKREERVGVTRASSFQVTCTNFTGLGMTQTPIAGAWMTVEAGFPEADEWASVATGKVSKATMNTEGDLVFDCYDPIKDILDGTLKRWVRFDDSQADGSAINAGAIADGSSGYNNGTAGAGVTNCFSANTGEQRFTIKFVTRDTFEVYDEGGVASSAGPYNINADAAVKFDKPTQSNVSMFTIQMEGWTQNDAGPVYHYSIGDEFYFDTARMRTTAELQPIALIQEILTSERFMNLFIYDPIAGEPYDSVFWDEDEWDDVNNNYSNPVRGEFEQGTKVIDVVKQLLRVASASLYAMPNGQIAIFAALPIYGTHVALNGDPSRGPVDILEATAEDDVSETYSSVKVKYINPSDGTETETVRSSDRSRLRTERIFEIDCSNLELSSGVIDGMLGLFLRRVENPPRRVRARTTLAAMGIDMKTPVQIVEPFISVDQQALTIEKTMDIMANEVEIVSSIDDYLLDDYAMVTDYTHDPYVSYVYDNPASEPDARKVF